MRTLVLNVDFHATALELQVVALLNHLLAHFNWLEDFVGRLEVADTYVHQV